MSPHRPLAAVVEAGEACYLACIVKTALTGIKPTNVPHLGNYLGAIRPAIEMAASGKYDCYYFIADYHSLTTIHDAKLMNEYVYEVAATWLAMGLDPAKVTIYRQSDIPEVFELTWVLSCLLATGQLERGHAYKDALAKGEAPNAGVFNYPVLMAADILLYDTDLVPVGSDQRQHLELCRDVAIRLNHIYGEGTLVVPDALIGDAPLVPGIDGEKMSKSRGNSIPLFASEKELKKVVMGIATSSEPLEAPKDPEGSTVVALFRYVAGEERARELESKLRAGGYGWGHAKLDLLSAIEEEIGPKREIFHRLRSDEEGLDRTLAAGAERARKIAHATMERVRSAIGIAPPRR